MAVTFRGWIDIGKAAVRWLGATFADRFTGFIGLASDSIAEAAALGMRASWLRHPDSPNDALAYVGLESSMPRYAADTNSSYRARLLDRWPTWQQGGTPPAITGQLAAFGVVSSRVIPAENADPRVTRPAWWFESPPDHNNWSRIAVVIEPGTFEAWYYGDGAHHYGDGSTYGSTASVDDVNAIKAIARKWKAGEEVNPYVYVILSGEYYGDPDIAYGDAGLVYGGEAIKWAHQV